MGQGLYIDNWVLISANTSNTAVNMLYSYHRKYVSLEWSRKILKGKTDQTQVAPSLNPETVTDNTQGINFMADDIHTLLDTVNGIVAVAPQ